MKKQLNSLQEKRQFIADLLVKLSQDVTAGKYGEDGCGANPDNRYYGLPDVLSDAEAGFVPDDHPELC